LSQFSFIFKSPIIRSNTVEVTLSWSCILLLFIDKLSLSKLIPHPLGWYPNQEESHKSLMHSFFNLACRARNSRSGNVRFRSSTYIPFGESKWAITGYQCVNYFTLIIIKRVYYSSWVDNRDLESSLSWYV